MNITQLVTEFTQTISAGKIEVYNEFSLQHEFGIFLRNNHPKLLVQFERNISHFGFTKSNFTKREIDISIFTPDKSNLHCAIELKFPRNGQHPEQMFSFCKDLAFAEELYHAGFKQTVFLAVVDDPLFHQGTSTGIYSHFRGKTPITGVITKPTGEKKKSVTIKGSYTIQWQPICGTMKYALVTIDNES